MNGLADLSQIGNPSLGIELIYSEHNSADALENIVENLGDKMVLRILLCYICFGTFFINPVFARTSPGPDGSSEAKYYTSTNEEAIDSAFILPPPPAIDSLAFLNDQAKYQEGLGLRNGDRGKLAILDAIGPRLHESLSIPFGIEINEKDTPAIYDLIYSVAGDLGDMSTRTAKQKYFRTRPYVLYNAPTCFPDEEEILRNNGSYPSGHSARAWGLALILAEINPARQEAILQRGYDMGQSRVICGYHWQSDVDAGRLAGAAGVASLHANSKFIERLEKAKKEFQTLKQNGKTK